MSLKKINYYCADFETTTYRGIKKTEVWAAGLMSMKHDLKWCYNNIKDFVKSVLSLKHKNTVIYFHNLKFDGVFLLDYFFKHDEFIHCFNVTNQETNDGFFIKDTFLPHGGFTYCISNRGQWYYLKLKWHGRIIEFRDSLKLLPFSIRQIGEGFKTAHRKTSIDYEAHLSAYEEITPQQEEYLYNDLYVMKEALQILFDKKCNRLTIGSCCIHEIKSQYGFYEYKKLCPNLYNLILLDHKEENIYSVGDWIRKTYSGAWCYLVPEKANKVLTDGITLDVNSLYPYVMHSMSGFRYPIGKPHHWKGNGIPSILKDKTKYFFVKVKCRFYIKYNHLPFIKIKHSLVYPDKHLETSDYFDKASNKYYPSYYDVHEKKVVEAKPILYLTMWDLKLLFNQYHVKEFEVLEGFWFYTKIGMFDQYIDKYMGIKQKEAGALMQWAKLMSNNGYGKYATSTDASYKVARLEDNRIKFTTNRQINKNKGGYIPIGSAITSHARYIEITAAQNNYYGSDKPGFAYADTDSLHINLISMIDLKGIELDSKEYGKFKKESHWKQAIFIRQKSYIEVVDEKNGQLLKENEIEIVCAGMPENCKNLLKISLMWNVLNKKPDKQIKKEIKKLDYESQKFVQQRRSLTDFKVGLIVPGKLTQKIIDGGVVLVRTPYIIREKVFIR